MDTNNFKDFIFNNVSACIINAMLAMMACAICWATMLMIRFQYGFNEIICVVPFFLIWAVLMFLYNKMRKKHGCKGVVFLNTIFIPYAVVAVCFVVYIELGLV